MHAWYPLLHYQKGSGRMGQLKLDTNRGLVFVNTKRERETHSQYKGEVDVEGMRYIIDIWESTSMAGKPYFKVRLERMRNQPSWGV